MHISTNDLHCCKPARLLQLAPSGGRPRRRPPATAPPRIAPPCHRRKAARRGQDDNDGRVPVRHAQVPADDVGQILADACEEEEHCEGDELRPEKDVEEVCAGPLAPGELALLRVPDEIELAVHEVAERDVVLAVAEDERAVRLCGLAAVLRGGPEAADLRARVWRRRSWRGWLE
jgi:hypothetical protein